MVEEREKEIYYYAHKLFPFAPEDFKKELSTRSQKVHVPANTIVGSPGSLCQASPIVLEGSLKVYLLLESGREIFLYRITAGETCMFTNISILKNIPYPAYAVAEVDTTGLLLDVRAVRDLFEKYSYWRNFVLEMIAKNFYELFVMLNELLSKRVDKRLIKYLYEKSLKSKILRLTHEDIAKDIGTVREVVSRLLKDLEKDEIIQLGRGEIIIKDVERLKKELSF
ncbi:Crp/Fnr family transcriptional regulator [Hydrogenobacter hydrogenophilus]|uniref:CRP/FNR family transcriptional regulator, anaerobic regulatory protein n=1 Tax=Hydrogenobacter hydrogenophilus TaxID=35835 RepID=A0A285NV38_9AQUI|nr:Crp/Fnr family transcriptional regulator [Hydrogenobacter hydrogenophilus]SNZ13340.1 CRP/FNR family transcriptional regulator, anaerobic regulatory protein [Hydrogenobacter hydrogenophilus]